MVSRVGIGSWSSTEEKKVQRGGPRENCLRKVHSLHCTFFLMRNESNRWWGKGSHFRVTSPSRKVDVALSIYIPKEETIFSMLNTLQAHSRFIHTILGSREEGPHGQVTHSVSQQCAPLAISQGGLLGSAPGHSPGQLSLFCFNISIQLSCHLILLLDGLQAAIQKQASSSPSQGWCWSRAVGFGCRRLLCACHTSSSALCPALAALRRCPDVEQSPVPRFCCPA